MPTRLPVTPAPFRSVRLMASARVSAEPQVSRALNVLVRAECLAREFLHRLPDLAGPGGRGHWRTEKHRDRLEQPLGSLEDEAPAVEAEDAAPHAVEINGDYRTIDACCDAFEAP